MIWPEMSVKSCISPENGGFDVRWVRFPKHIPLFSTLSQLEPVGLVDFRDWVQRVTNEKDKFSSCYLDDLGRHIPLALLVAGTHRLR